MDTQVQESTLANFLIEEADQGKNNIEIALDLKKTYGTSIEPEEFSMAFKDTFGAKDYTPLEFAQMAKIYYGNPNDVAKCIKIEYTEFTALQTGKLLLQPTIYPELSIDEMTEALNYAGYAKDEVDRAIDELYGETTVGYVLMLDSSGSMYDSIGMVKIDAKAFTGYSKYKDQFGINQFNYNASWVYPNDSNIVTVDKDLNVLNDASNAIEDKIKDTGGRTNLGEAIQLGNEMINQATTDTKAFVILSDGASNIGPSPVSVLGNEPPIFVAGLGRYVKRENFTDLLAKNSKSKFYWKPDAIGMMEIFNDIRAVPKDVDVTTNGTSQYTGSNFQIIESLISAESEEAQFSVVWSNPECQYTPDNPSGYNVNVVLYDPTGKKTKFKPQITGPGYCIFNVYGVRPGTWKTLVQYSVPDNLYGTTGGFEFNTLTTLDVEAPYIHKKGEPLTFTAKLLGDGKPIENAVVQAQVISPQLSVENALNKYKNELLNVTPDDNFIKKGVDENIAKLHTLRMSKIKTEDILPVAKNGLMLKQNKNGHFEGKIIPAEAGAYNIKVIAHGVNPVTKKHFSRVAEHAILVG